jgi:hypothetical protein
MANLFTATRTVAFVTKLFAAANLNLQSMVDAGEENALKAHIEKATAAAPATPGTPTAEEIAEVNASLEKAVKENETLGAQVKDLSAKNAKAAEETISLNAQITTLTAQLTAVRAAKIEFAADAKPEAITAAVAARISKAAGEELAKHGLTQFPEQNVEADPTKPEAKNETKNLTGLAKVQAAFAAQSAKR